MTYRPAGAHATEPPGRSEPIGAATCVRTSVRSAAADVTGTASAANTTAPTSPPQTRRTEKILAVRTRISQSATGSSGLGQPEMPFGDVVAIDLARAAI